MKGLYLIYFNWLRDHNFNKFLLLGFKGLKGETGDLGLEGFKGKLIRINWELNDFKKIFSRSKG